MKQAKFNELKYGDRLVDIDSAGNWKLYVYLCPDPGYKEEYAFLMLFVGTEARHFFKPRIEEMYVYEDFKEVTELANKTKAEYYRSWLEAYESQKHNL